MIVPAGGKPPKIERFFCVPGSDQSHENAVERATKHGIHAAQPNPCSQMDGSADLAVLGGLERITLKRGA
jgi:hypothetical protein